MEARLSAVQRWLFLLLLASLAVAVIARPAPENRRLVRALAEVTAFRMAFDPKAAEQSLEQQALAQTAQSLDGVVDMVRAPRGLKLKLAPDAGPVRALAAVRLATLAEVVAHAQPETDLTVGVADLNALGASLTWRLARSERTGPFSLSRVEVLPAAVTREEVELDREVGELRVVSLEARAQVESAARRVELLEGRVEAQAKRRSKSLFKSRLALEDARQLLAERTEAHAEVQKRYEQGAARAERPRQTLETHVVPSVAVARVAVEVGADKLLYDVPVPLEQRKVRVTSLKVAGFPALRAASLWSELKDKDAGSAAGIIEARFNWQLHRFTLFGLGVDGTSVLQLLPCLLPLLLAMLLVGMRRAETSYSPFGTTAPTSLPPIGLKSRALELVAIIILPLLGVASAAASLVLNDRVPVVPALVGVACVVLGVDAFSKLHDLREQTLSIVRHSVPPQPAGD